jgi:hypothetical protein
MIIYDDFGIVWGVIMAVQSNNKHWFGKLDDWSADRFELDCPECDTGVR